MCDKSFGRRGDLNSHMRSVHDHDYDMPPAGIPPRSQGPSGDAADILEILTNPGPSKVWEYIGDWDNPGTDESCWREV